MKSHLDFRSPRSGRGRRWRRLPLWVAAAIGLCGNRTVLQADVIIFKDGFVVHGKITRECEPITDKLSGQTLYAPKGPFFVRDGARKISFPHTYVQDVVSRDFEPTDTVKLTMGSAGNRIA